MRTSPTDEEHGPHMPPESSERFDFVVVGSGSAGSVLADRLSADPANRVLLLEAGRPDSRWDAYVHIPAALGFPVGSRFHDWCYRSEPEPHLNGRRLAHARGKLLGGSSSINAMVFQRGHPRDYDRWGAGSGMASWSYAHCLPYFKRLETSAVRSSEELRGYDGPQPLERASATDALLLTLFLAALQAGHPRSTDTNGREPEGFAMWERTIARGLRVSAARAFLHPAMRRPNLTVRTRTLVTKVLFSGRRAVGVRCEDRSGRLFDVRAGQVVLSGGAFNSPQLLQLSGVGNGPELAALGIPVVHELPAVGQHLQDHLVAKVQHRCTEPITMDVLRDKRRWPAIAIRWLLTRGGPAATNLYEAGAFLRTGPHVDYPDLMLGFAPAAMRFDPNAPDRGYQMIMAGMRAEARGSVTITSADPHQPPALRFNYLSTEADRRFWVDAVRTTRELLAQPAFREIDGGETYPGSAVESDRQILDWVTRTAESNMHPTSTCRMGTDDRSVLDPATMQVHGLEAISVVDASAMPHCPNSATHAPTMMLAEKASDLLLGNTPLTPAALAAPAVTTSVLPHPRVPGLQTPRSAEAGQK
jgi:choline dehydrogenase